MITITLEKKNVFNNRKNNVVQFLYMKLKKNCMKGLTKKIRNQSNKDQIKKKIYYKLKLKMKFKTNKNLHYSREQKLKIKRTRLKVEILIIKRKILSCQHNSRGNKRGRKKRAPLITIHPITTITRHSNRKKTS